MLGYLNSIFPQICLLLDPSQVTTLRDLLMHAFVPFEMVFRWAHKLI